MRNFPIGIWSAIANVWFVAWAIRHRGELDYQLDHAAQIIRWLFVAFFLGVPIQAPRLLTSPNLRMSFGIVGMAFLVWPNCAYHLTRLLRRWRVLPNAEPVQPGPTTRGSDTG